MHFARSGIDGPLKVSAVFGMISGVLFTSSLAYEALIYHPGPFSYSSQLDVFFSLVPGMAYGLLIIFGSRVVLFSSMSIERRGVLALFVFIASVFAMIGSLLFFSSVLLGLLGSNWRVHKMTIWSLSLRSAGPSRFALLPLPDVS